MRHRTAALTRLEVFARLGHGKEINFEPGPGLLPFLGDRRSGRLAMTFRPAPHLQLDHTNLYTRRWADCLLS